MWLYDSCASIWALLTKTGLPKFLADDFFVLFANQRGWMTQPIATLERPSILSQWRGRILQKFLTDDHFQFY